MAHKNDPASSSRLPATARPGSRTQLKEITGGVINNIHKWLWTRSKRIRLDPRKPWKMQENPRKFGKISTLKIS